MISNAIRYGGDGKYLGMFLRADQAHIYIDIVDRGRGIEKEFADSVFDRLFMMEDSRNSAMQGNGLGLTIAKNLALQLGGRYYFRKSSAPENSFHYYAQENGLLNHRSFFQERNLLRIIQEF